MPGGFRGDQYSCEATETLNPGAKPILFPHPSVRLIINDRVLPSREERVTSLFRNVGPNVARFYSTFRNAWKVGLDLPVGEMC